MWQQAERYPDPAITTLDSRFQQYRLYSAVIERLATGMRWAEGPAWFGDGRYLLWSDVPNNRILRWSEDAGQVSSFRQSSNFANGNTRDRQGRLVTCEHGTRRVTRTEYDGRITVLCDNYQGKRLNSPNDIVVKSDGSIWFTDPEFGILGYYEGERNTPELSTNIYRIDGQSGQVTMLSNDVKRPNGLCFSPDEKTLYVVESGETPRRIRAFALSDDGQSLRKDRVFVQCVDNESPDGFRCDIDGNIWAGWGTGEGRDGVMVFAPDGERIGHIALPERCANLCFGGVHRNRLFMAASQSLYSLFVNTQGIPYN